MKHIKLFEDFNFLTEKKIKMYVGPYQGTAFNGDLFKEVNKLLLSEKNPLKAFFDEGLFYLKNTNEMAIHIGAKKGSDVDEKTATELYKFIKDNVETYGGERKHFNVYVGDWAFAYDNPHVRNIK